MKLKSYFNPNTKEAQIRLATDAAPAAPFVALGDITHEAGDNASGMQLLAVSHVVYQHVQERLYIQYGLQNMQIIKITNAGGFVMPTSIHVDPGQTYGGKPEDVKKLKITVIPANAITGPLTAKAHDRGLVKLVVNQEDKTIDYSFTAPGASIVSIAFPEVAFFQEVSVEARDHWYAINSY